MSKVEENARAERSRVRAHLMEHMQQGDSEACRALLDDIGPSVMQFLRRRVADANELDDAYQEVLMALFEARHTYEPGRPPEPPSSPPDLGEALAKLPRAQREAFAMLKLEGLSLEGAAERAGVSVGALKVRAHRAYKTLRKLIGG